MHIVVRMRAKPLMVPQECENHSNQNHHVLASVLLQSDRINKTDIITEHQAAVKISQQPKSIETKKTPKSEANERKQR